MSLYNYITNGIYSQSCMRAFSQFTDSVYLEYPWNFFWRWKLLWRGEQVALLNPGRVGPRAALIWISVVVFFMFILRENWSWRIYWIIVLQYYPLGLFPHKTLSVFDTLAKIVQPRIKIMAQLKKMLSSEAIHKIPFKIGSADIAHLVLCVCRITW